MLFLDFDEFLEVHFENNKSLILKDFLENKIFDKCEAVLFNVLVHTDNNLTDHLMLDSLNRIINSKLII